MLSVLTQFFLIKISNFNMQTFNKFRCPETGQNLSSFFLFFENRICPLFGTSGHPKSHLSRSGQILSSKKNYACDHSEKSTWQASGPECHVLGKGGGGWGERRLAGAGTQKGFEFELLQLSPSRHKLALRQRDVVGGLILTAII